MKLIYKFSMDDFIKDYVKNQKIYFSSIAWNLGVLALTLGTAVLEGFEIPGPQSLLVLIGILSAAIAIYLIAKSRWSAGLKKQLLKEWPEHWPIDFNAEIELQPDAIKHTDLLSETRIPYANIKGAKEEKGFVSIDFKFSDGISVPVVQIQNIGEKDMFLTELKGKISAS